MLDISKIKWNREEYTLEKFVDLFPLPQVVRINAANSKENNNWRGEPQNSPPFNDVFVLHSVRNKEVIRATDSLKNEFYLPHDSTAKVEVVWKDYKKYYDNVEELFNDFPVHVLVVEEDECLGIRKGDVLKLKRSIKINRENKCLKCAFLDKTRADVNIPFQYRGLFKTLGELETETVYLKDAVEFCKLPRVVKFIDNKLKVKRIEGKSQCPSSLSSLGNVTLHEVTDHTDVIVSQTTSNGQVIVSSIPLDINVRIFAPTAASRGDPNYACICSTIDEKTTEEMVKNIGISHQHWVVFQEDDTQSTSSWSHQILSLVALGGFEDVQSVNEANGSIEMNRRISVDDKAPFLPPKLKADQPPPIPPKVPLSPHMGQGLSKAPPSPRRRREERKNPISSPTVPFPDNNKSKSMPRMLSPSQTECSDTPGIYVKFSYVANEAQSQVQTRGEGPKDHRLHDLFQVRYGGANSLEGDGGYVPMNHQVSHLQSKCELLCESLQKHIHSGDSNSKVKVLSNLTVEKLIPEDSNHPGGEQPRPIISPGQKQRKERTSVQKEERHEPNKPQNLVGNLGRRGSTFPRRSVHNSVTNENEVNPVGSSNISQGLNDSKEEIHLNIKFKDSGAKCDIYSEVRPLMVNADLQNDLSSLTKSPTKLPKIPSDFEFINSKHIKSWSQEEVLKFLKFINLERYKEAFEDKKIDGQMIASLDQKALRELCVPNSSHAAMIIRLVHECIKYEESALSIEYVP